MDIQKQIEEALNELKNAPNGTEEVANAYKKIELMAPQWLTHQQSIISQQTETIARQRSEIDAITRELIESAEQYSEQTYGALAIRCAVQRDNANKLVSQQTAEIERSNREIENSIHSFQMLQMENGKLKAETERLKAMLPQPRRKCMACNGSGRYDSHGSPPCGSCDGTGEEYT